MCWRCCCIWRRGCRGCSWHSRIVPKLSMHLKTSSASCAILVAYPHGPALCMSGVQGTAVPSDWLLEKHYTSHLSSSTHTPALSSSHKCNSAAAAGHNGTVSGTALLLDSCNWLPPMEGWPGVVELPIPTRALVDALREHLESHLAHPKVSAGGTTTLPGWQNRLCDCMCAT